MANKVTKVQAISAIIEKYGVSGDDKSFLEHEIEMIQNRYANRSNKPSKKQIANASLTEILFGLFEEGKIYTATDLAGLLGVDEKGEPYSPQKVSALLRTLKAEGKVVDGTIKRRTYFGLPDAEFVLPTADAE